MPVVTIAVAVPPDTIAVEVGDADDDGRDDLIFVSRAEQKGAPDRITLTVQRFAADGAATARSTVVLGNRPTLWDANDGLWAIDREGLVRLDLAGGAPTRIVKFPTILAGLGPTTPQRARIATDIDSDGLPELIAWSAGTYVGFRTDGTPLGSVPAVARGDVKQGYEQGGTQATATVRPPPLTLGDVDGDGRIDLAMPDGERLHVYFTGASLGSRAVELRLPLDLDPPPPPPGVSGTRRDIRGVWLQDLDGDKKIDLGVHRDVFTGSWFGASTEWLWARGTGAGFEPFQTLEFGKAGFGLEPVDADGDGDRDLRLITADIGLGNIARALMSKEARGELALVRWAGGYGAAASVRTLTFPIERFETFHLEYDADVDGDKIIDLVTDEGGATVGVFRGTSGALAATAAWEIAIQVPPGEDRLLVHDLTGDGRAEIVIWGAQAHISRVTP